VLETSIVKTTNVLYAAKWENRLRPYHVMIGCSSHLLATQDPA